MFTARSTFRPPSSPFACLALLVFTGPAGAQGGGRAVHRHACVRRPGAGKGPAEPGPALGRHARRAAQAGPEPPAVPAATPPARTRSRRRSRARRRGPSTRSRSARTPAVDVTDSGSGSGLDWTTIAIGIAGSLLVLGGVVAVVAHGRRAGRVHASA